MTLVVLIPKRRQGCIRLLGNNITEILINSLYYKKLLKLNIKHHEYLEIKLQKKLKK